MANHSLLYCPSSMMVYWFIKTLWWEGIMCSQEIKQVFVSKQSRKTFVCHLILQAGKIKCSNRDEMIDLYLKSPSLKVSDSCSWDSTKICLHSGLSQHWVFVCSVILHSSNASAKQHSNVQKKSLMQTFHLTVQYHKKTTTSQSSTQ